MDSTSKISYITFDGLDCTGKGTLIEKLRSSFDVAVVQSPPPSLRKYRHLLDDLPHDLRLRFVFYMFGNILANKQIIQLRTELADLLILQDRSSLSTLAAHEVRGLSKFWLNLGANIASNFITPDKALIIHVDKLERQKRLEHRGMNRIDKENLCYDSAMEFGYAKWAKNLGWNLEWFDNTQYTGMPQQSLEALVNKLEI
jgi:thymidylate kinase